MSKCTVKLTSRYLFAPADINIILPNPPADETPKDYYESGKKFPVLWVLHGGAGTYADWADYSNISRLAIERRVIIVMPVAHNSDFVDHPEIGEGFYFHKYFIEELMPFIYNYFPASSNPKDNFITGNSMGAAATWQYGVRHPELFGWIAPLCNQPLDYSYLEKYRDLTGAEFRAEFEKDPKAIPAAYGFAGSSMHDKEVNSIAKYKTVGDFLDSIENTLPRFWEAVAAGKIPNIFLPGGAETRDKKLGIFIQQCEEKGIKGKKIFFERTDTFTHCSDFWEKSVARFLDFIGKEKVEKSWV